MGVYMQVASGYGFVVDEVSLERWFARTHPSDDPDDYGTDELLDKFLEDYPLLTNELAGNAWVGETQHAVMIRQTSQTLDFGSGFRYLNDDDTHDGLDEGCYHQLLNAMQTLYGDKALVENAHGWLVGGYID